MPDLDQRVSALRELNRRTARTAVELFDNLKELTPAHLLEGQDALRADLLGTESDLREAKEQLRICRAPENRKRPDFRETEATLRTLVRLHELRRSILRQVGDTYAWTILRQNPRIILPLYREKTHWLPSNEGVGGPAAIAREAMNTGDFFVIENDLTRCLGAGDLTVVFSKRPWHLPIAIEVKSSAPDGWHEGGRLGLLSIIPHSDHPTHLELLEAFRQAVGAEELTESDQGRDRPEQTAELVAAVELMVRASGAGGTWAPASSPKMWEALDRVLSKALAEEWCWEIAETGVAFASSTAVDDVVPAEYGVEFVARLRELGYTTRAGTVSSTHFRDRGECGAIVPPIILWPVAKDARAALLCGELVFDCVVRDGSWEAAMQASGLQLTRDGKAWVVVGKGAATRFDVLEVGKLMLGVAFGGVSPTEIARRTSEALERVSSPSVETPPSVPQPGDSADRSTKSTVMGSGDEEASSSDELV